MKNGERLVWTLLALGAFLAGTGSRWGSSQDGSGSLLFGSANANSAGSGRVAGSHDRGDADLSAPERAVLVERTALASPLRTGRFMGMMAALDQVHPDTWQSMWEEFKRQTTEDGRVHEVEWSLFMNRVGEIDGAAAMAFFEKNGQPEYTFNRREILSGWAAADPEGAIRWMESQPPDSPNQELQPTLLTGVIQSNPDLALSLLAKADPKTSQRMAGDFVGDLIQAKGIQWTMDKLVALRASDSPPPYVALMYREISNRVGRMSWLAGNDNAVNEWRKKTGDGGQAQVEEADHR